MKKLPYVIITHRKAIIMICFLAFHINASFAQIQSTVAITDANCTSNGSIEITASGGSGNYSYDLSGGDIDGNIIEEESTFENLFPGDYVLVIIDTETGDGFYQEITIGGNYQPPILTLAQQSCGTFAVVQGGLAPFVYSISTEGQDGPFQTNSPPDNPNFPDLSPDETYWIQVQDACGNTFPIKYFGGTGGITGMNVSTSGDIMSVSNINGGLGNFTYTLTSSNNPPITNETGVFPSSTWGCDMTVTVSDGCTEDSRPFDPRPNIDNICVDFDNGTASMDISGIPPLTVTVGTSQGFFQSNDGTFTGLPPDASRLIFRIRDGCGQSASRDWVEYPRAVVLVPENVSCEDSILNLTPFIKPCTGGFDDGIALPIVTTCLSCPDTITETFQSLYEEVTFEGSAPGEWEILITDECGDTTWCEDILRFEVEPFCDSLKATFGQRLECDNDVSSFRPLLTDSVYYYLLDEDDMVLDSNLTGAFGGLFYGNYTVQMTPPCKAPLSETVELRKRDFYPPFEAYIKSRWINGACRIVYNLRFSAAYGDMLMEGENFYEVIDEYDMTENCTNYWVTNVSPGDYTMTALEFCGDTVIHLPMPEFNLEAEVDGTCPGAATITVTGARPRSYWQNWSSENDIYIDWSDYWDNGFIDNYSLDEVTSANFFQNGSPYVFQAVSPGHHEIYLYAFNSSCPVASTSVFVPQPTYPALDVPTRVLCDGENSLDLTFSFSGPPPYTLQRVSCFNYSYVIENIVTTRDGSYAFNVPAGNSCFRLVDSCGTSVDRQINLRHFEDDIRITPYCDNTIKLRVDAINADYAWYDADGNLVGDSYQVYVENPSIATTYTVHIDIGACIIERTVEVAPMLIIPEVSISGDPFLCDSDTVLLTATSDVENIKWNTGATTTQIEVNEADTYTIVATSEFDCTTTAHFDVLQIEPYDIPFIGDLFLCPEDSGWISLDLEYEQILWSDGSIADSLQVFPNDIIQVQIIDGYDCTWENEVEIIPYPSPEPEIVGETLICEDSTSYLSLSLPYSTYLWSDSTANADMIAFKGDYGVSITDERGCFGETAIAISEIPTIEVHLAGDTLLCKDSTAIIQIDLENHSNAAYINFNLSLFPEPIIIEQDTNLTFSATQNTNVFVETVEVANYNCQFLLPDTVEIITNQPDLVLATSDYNGFEISCVGMADGSITVTPTAGIPPFSFLWSNGTTLPINDSLEAGIHTVTITDSLACIATKIHILSPPPSIQPLLVLQPPHCVGIDDGAVGVSNWVGGVGNVDIFLNGAFAGPAPALFEQLEPGEYIFQLEDENDCTFDTSFIFQEPLELEVDLGKDQWLKLGDSIQLRPITNFEVADFEWTHHTFLSEDVLEPWSRPLEEIIYELTLWSEYGCQIEDRVKIWVDKHELLYVPNVFSPDGDGNNDWFTLFAKQGSIENIHELAIFDRWGDMVFNREDFLPNLPELGWDGYFEGKPMNPAVFGFWAKVEFIDGRIELVKGDVTLVR